MNSLKILVAPNSYKGCLHAYEVAEFMEQGILEAFPQAEVHKMAVADGGEGTVKAIIGAIGGRLHEVKVTGPLGNPVKADIGLMKEGHTAVIEAASASGLTLVPKERLNPMLTTTYGTGQLIKEALELGCRKLIIGIGGSATNDGGVGMAQALGARFLNKDGENIGYGGGELESICRIDLSDMDPRIAECEFIIASDVTNPLCGENGASAVFGPQKGATPEMVRSLDNGLLHLSRVIESELGKDIANLQGAGAAGGLGGGLMAFLPGKMARGIDIVLEAADFENRVQQMDFVITGEGHTDHQTSFGKTPVGIARLAKKFNVPVICISGGITSDVQGLYEQGINVIVGVAQRPMTLEEAMIHAPALIRHAVSSVIRTLMITMRPEA
ncbi:glycerate kinase [Paenibacillus prosopidis]|uniref:glycerate kinase n=1 Tax=Paenibacillus prosopidis TaxID=630520 RepID=UPI001FEAB833|nr:glycerate kinase [Paenibacillus prosopidis]